jgi:hypothetical protein
MFQMATLKRLDLWGRQELRGGFPNRDQRAYVCTGLVEGTPHEWEMVRREFDNQDSGWLFACFKDDDHAHSNPKSFGPTHLRNQVFRYPRALPYLAMPFGSIVRFEKEHVLVFLPGASELIRDEAPAFVIAARDE